MVANLRGLEGAGSEGRITEFSDRFDRFQVGLPMHFSGPLVTGPHLLLGQSRIG